LLGSGRKRQRLSLEAHDPLTTTAPMESVSACPKIVTLSKIVH
jgi:hypothetical protein